ncbi:hypothetical protein AEQ67_28340 [Pseudomonas sp. RIT-PI-q]|uniref:hypothetical protein n=1 Tax=Pseudomonas sp. RIT-PI-q TaxID=1690247 RepID=UPI0006CCE17E|nr:hypothetical protein [Pseudomonas sp. RIT-PI-q]KPG91895.1 hypothetical protein AEQ67_28340 [Pseudomonas sp. RIT-PI-q]
MRELILSATCLFAIGDVSASIEWEVESPFRLVDYGGEGAGFNIKKGQTALDFVVERFGQGSRAIPPPIYNLRIKKNSDASFNFSNEYVFPKVEKVVARLSNPPIGDCKWVYQDVSAVKPCRSDFKFAAITQFGTGNAILYVSSPSSGFEDKTSVVIRDRLILGMGDSFASGEGNPDIPTVVDRNGLESFYQSNNDAFKNGRWMLFTHHWVAKKAEWFNGQCHRSMLSQQVLAALRLAGDDKHSSITLMPLACSGAEVLDGVLTPQQNPPGGGKTVIDSQINMAVTGLCKDGRLKESDITIYRGHTGSKDMVKTVTPIKKCVGEIRVPDAILLSIGGNDVAFAPSIAWATIPADSRNFAGARAVNITNNQIEPVCPKETDQRICEKNKPVGRDRIKYWLPTYYSYMQQQLISTGLAEEGKGTVYLTAYPNPSYLEDGKTLCGVDRSADVVEQARYSIPVFFRPSVWQLRFTKDEMKVMNDGLIKPLYQQMKDSAHKYGWTLVDGYLDTVKMHGICAGFERKDSQEGNVESKLIPLYPHIVGGKWYPIAPWDDWAYDSSKVRWFRNTNDSVLYQNDDTPSIMNGAFHPDFRVHAAIADYIYESVSMAWRVKEGREGVNLKQPSAGL